jgi:phage/plasmid-like protein (TIGR03299 family)
MQTTFLRPGSYNTVSQAAIAPGNDVMVYGRYRERGYHVEPLTSRAGGVFTPENASASEAFALAGLNWTAEKRDALYSPDGITIKPAPDHCSIVRSDTGGLLGIHGAGYTPLQHTAIINLLDYLREDIQIESVLNIRQGRKVVVSASLKLQDEVVPGDRIRRYIHIFNSHDGSSAFGVMFSDRRLRCANEINFITGRAFHNAVAEGHGLRARHTVNVEQFAHSLPELINLQQQSFHQRIWEMQDMAATLCTIEMARRILEQTYADRLATPVKERNGDTRPRHLGDIRDFDTIMSHYQGRTGYGINDDANPIGGTVYGLYNAITQFHTHDAGRKTDATDHARARLESLWGGPSATRVEKAYQACLAAC